jgi:BioD-like phosphotransacetylase family protein
LVALLVTSPEKGSGKTTLCAGLGRYLQNASKKVGYLKPGGADGDTEFMKNALSLEETAEALRPPLSEVKGACDRVARGKDVVLVESDYESATDIVKALGGKTLVVEEYSGKTSDYKKLGNSLLGVVVNKVPVSRMEQARSKAKDPLGILPEDRALLGLTIGELTGRIKGEVLRGAEKSAELVENVMLGALTVDHGPDYFGRKGNKMVILRSDRPDMQMAAMETSTRCIVITGDTPLKDVVLERAEEKDMPIIRVKEDSTAVVENIEGALGGGKLSQGAKLPRIVELVEQNMDLKKLSKGLGLSG